MPDISASVLRKGIKEVVLHPGILPYAMKHSEKEVMVRLKQLESLRLTPKTAFHNDSILQHFLLSSLDFFRVVTFFEAGTFRGDSVIWLADKVQNIKTISCESEEYFYKRTLRRLSRIRMDDRVRLINKSSPMAIKECFESGLLQEPALFWLDAHWNEYWPLTDELKEILRCCKSSILVIDDFKVPNNPQLEYDTYNGIENSLEYISPLFHSNSANVQLDFLFPNYDNSQLVIKSKFRPRGYVAIFLGLRRGLQQFETKFEDLSKNFIHKVGQDF